MDTTTKPTPSIRDANRVFDAIAASKDHVPPTSTTTTTITPAIPSGPLPTQPTPRAPPAAPSSAPPPPAAEPKSNSKTDEIITKRSICLRKIQKYRKYFDKDVGDLIPAHLGNLTLDQLETICMSCDAKIGDASSKDTIGFIVIALLSGIENYALPFIPQGHMYKGLTQFTDICMKSEEETPFTRALNRVAIKYTGVIETNAEVGLLIVMCQMFHHVRMMNEQHGMSADTEEYSARPEEQQENHIKIPPRNRL